MNVILDLCVVPRGVGVSISEYIAACQKIIQAADLKPHLRAYGTNSEGPWDEVMEAVKQSHLKIHAMGAPRITTTIKMGTRVDRSQSMADKISSVRAKLE